MSEVEKSAGGMSKLKAYASLAGTAVAGLWLLSNAGPLGVGILGLVAVGGVAAYSGVYAGGGFEGAVSSVTSLFSKVGRFYKEAFSVARKDVEQAQEWARTQEAERASTLGSKTSAPDFGKAANANELEENLKAPAPAPKQTLNM